MKNLKVPVIITFIVLIAIGFFYFLSKLAPARYPDAEYYIIELPKNELVKRVMTFKEENAMYNPPTENKLEDKTDEVGDYRFYIYYSDRSEILHCLVRGDSSKGLIAFDAVNKGLTLGNWETINRDFDDDANEFQKKLFKERIVNPILKTNISKK